MPAAIADILREETRFLGTEVVEFFSEDREEFEMGSGEEGGGEESVGEEGVWGEDDREKERAGADFLL